MASGAGSEADLENKYARQRDQAKICPLGASLACACFLFIIAATLFPDCEALTCPTTDNFTATADNANCPDECELIVDGRTNTVRGCFYPIPDGECPPAQQTGGTPVFFWVLTILVPVAGVGLYVKQLAYIHSQEAADKEQQAAGGGGGSQMMQQMPLPAPVAGGLAQPTQQVLSVACPPGVGPGGMLQIQQNGAMLQVQVPPGVQPGVSFQVMV